MHGSLISVALVGGFVAQWWLRGSDGGSEKRFRRRSPAAGLKRPGCWAGHKSRMTRRDIEVRRREGGDGRAEIYFLIRQYT